MFAACQRLVSARVTTTALKNFSSSSARVMHDLKMKEFSLQHGDDKAVLQYKEIGPSVIDLEHTIVPKKLQGKGIGNELAEAALKYASDKNLQVKISCGFVQKYMEKHPESPFKKILIDK